MKKCRNILIIASAVILLAAGCNKAQPEQQQSQPPQNQQEPNQQTTIPGGQTQTSQNPGGPDYFPNGQQLGGVAKAPTITVTQAVEGSNFNKPTEVVQEGETALDLLKRDHQVDTKIYSGMGEFVISIDGIKPDSKRFWAFYLNGKSSSVGASGYKLKDGDKIEWKLETIK
jgi:hypothetical protein